MSGRSYNHYMRPQDRDGNNHASGRGRSQHLAPSRGRSRERSYDVHYDERNYRTERDMRGDEGRRDQYHRSRSSDYAPHSRSHRSRSYDPHPTRYNSSHHDNSSRKRHRSPDHVASAIYKTMSTIDLEAQEASVMADQRTQDMSVVHLHLPMAMERRCIELQLMHFIELRTPKTMLMHRMVAI